MNRQEHAVQWLRERELEYTHSIDQCGYYSNIVACLAWLESLAPEPLPSTSLTGILSKCLQDGTTADNTVAAIYWSDLPGKPTLQILENVRKNYVRYASTYVRT
jgi:hypothetical protein